MAGGRRPGPAQNPQRRRTNADPLLPAGEGWAEISGDAWDGAIPPVPDWVRVSPDALRVYAELARLPQAALWGPGTWFELHLALPLIDRYLDRPGSEGFKALVSALGAGLSLTELDMAKARIKVRPSEPNEGADEPAPVGKVADIRERRRRITG